MQGNFKSLTICSIKPTAKLTVPGIAGRCLNLVWLHRSIGEEMPPLAAGHEKAAICQNRSTPYCESDMEGAISSWSWPEPVY